jgi:hypothetical protein
MSVIIVVNQVIYFTNANFLLPAMALFFLNLNSNPIPNKNKKEEAINIL